jgi:hypothetical protein
LRLVAGFLLRAGFQDGGRITTDGATEGLIVIFLCRGFFWVDFVAVAFVVRRGAGLVMDFVLGVGFLATWALVALAEGEVAVRAGFFSLVDRGVTFESFGGFDVEGFEANFTFASFKVEVLFFSAAGFLAVRDCLPVEDDLTFLTFGA